MGKLFRSLGREIKLGFKTVTFNFKQYFCFFVAILAMQIMFGIIIMSASNNMYQYEKKTLDDYDSYDHGYHFAMTNLPEDARQYFAGKAREYESFGYYVRSSDGFVYVYVDTSVNEGVNAKSLEQSVKDFKTKFVSKMHSANIDNADITYEYSPLYTLSNKMMSMRLECAAKLLVLALVSIAVIILLFNIRLNHFKFTYGIYRSFGADTKKLFSTSFWEMMVIGLLTVIPAGAIATFVDYYFYVSEDFKYRFAPWLMAFALVFIIPIFLISVFVPIKYTASKPPLQLLLAEDNSNLVSSPRLSTQLLGKRFPSSYEGLGLWRFRRYCATLVASSVLFASIFVWITFYKDIYDFDTQQEQAEFTVNTKYEVEKVTEYVAPDEDEREKYEVSNEFKNARKSIYALEVTNPLYMQRVINFERYFIDSTYTITRATSGDAKGRITGIKASGQDETVLWDQFTADCGAILKETIFKDGSFSTNSYAISMFREFEAFFNQEKYLLEGDKDPSSGKLTYIGSIYKKIPVTKEVEIYGEMLDSDRQALDAIVTQYGYTYKQCVSDESSKYAYLALQLDNVRPFSGYEVNIKDRTQRITPNIDIFALDQDEEVLNYIERNYEYEGKLQDINKEGYVFISETAANRKVLKIKPGDTIDIMVRTGNSVKPKANTAEDYLADLIREGEQFEKRTFTVAAVIKNMPTGTNLPIFLDSNDFEAVTGSKVRYNQVSVYVTPTISNAEVNELHSELVEWADDFATIEWNKAVAESREKTEERNLPVIQMIALFALVLSPLFWFFSQIMFFGKREEEFSMLRGMGAVESEIRRIFSKDGLVYAGLGVLSTVVFSLVGVFAIHKINMAFVARLNTEARVLYKFNFGLFVTNLEGDTLLNPLWVSLAIAVVLTAICGYLSSMIPYMIDRKKAKKTVSKEFGE